MFNRTNALGTVSYKGQRALILAVLLNPKFPQCFTSDRVVAALDEEAYRRTFKSETSVADSVYWH